jgi:hypothetical protein
MTVFNNYAMRIDRLSEHLQQLCNANGWIVTGMWSRTTTSTSVWWQIDRLGCHHNHDQQWLYLQLVWDDENQ